MIWNKQIPTYIYSHHMQIKLIARVFRDNNFQSFQLFSNFQYLCTILKSGPVVGIPYPSLPTLPWSCLVDESDVSTSDLSVWGAILGVFLHIVGDRFNRTINVVNAVLKLKRIAVVRRATRWSGRLPVSSRNLIRTAVVFDRTNCVTPDSWITLWGSLKLFQLMFMS